MPRNNDELGALWTKSGPKGKYFTGKLGDTPVVAFINREKKNPKEPDVRILKARSREEREADDDAPPF